MEKIKVEGKTLEEAKQKALEQLNASEEEVIIRTIEEKTGLFTKKAEIEAITITELNKSIKEYLLNLVKSMGITANIEVKTREESPIFNIIVKDQPILIGKFGRTIEALQVLASQMVSTELNTYYRFTVDVNDYKQRRTARLEKLAKYTAKDVAKSGIEVKLDSMNSYERRIIHNVLNNSRDVVTESSGEEPNRCVVIKPKEEN